MAVTIERNTGSARTGSLTVASQTVMVEQAAAPCTYAIRPTNYNAGRGPDTVTINVTAGPGCPWTTRVDDLRDEAGNVIRIERTAGGVKSVLLDAVYRNAR